MEQPKRMYPTLQLRFVALVALLVASAAITACSAVDKLGVALVEDQAREIEASSWSELLENFTNNELCGAPGAVLLVDSPQGRFIEATGVSELGTDTPMEVTDSFEIGSNTKSFTVVLALQLQEDGMWSLDDPLSKWLPEVAAQLPNGDDVTLRQLASNTSGIWDYADPLMTAAAPFAEERMRDYSPDELVEYAIANGKPEFEPGEDWSYSSTNFVLLGMAIESLTGQSLDELYQSNVIGPLGMDDTMMLQGVPEPGQVVHGYHTLDDADEQDDSEPLDVTDWNATQGWAAGALVSTADDMATYARALAAGELFDDPDSLAQMTDFRETNAADAGLMTAYGLGAGEMPLDGPQAWGHHGQTMGHTTLFMTIPEKDTVLIYLTNSSDCMAPLIVPAIEMELLDGDVGSS